MQERALPSFDRPPLVEAVLGVQFDQLEGFGNAHLGAFWQSLGEGWDQVADAPPLEPTVEEFGRAQAWSPEGIRMRLTQALSTRLQMRGAARDAMIQVQNGRLHHNWLGESGGPYPRYTRIREEFDELLKAFRRFAEEAGFGPVRVNQWEITYVNKIAQGTVWKTLEDLGILLPSLLGTMSFDDVALETFGGKWRFEIPPQRGRLHVSVAHSRDEQGDETITMQLTARGPVRDDSEYSLDAGLSIGHESIVLAFAGLTSKDAHEHWGVRYEHSNR